MSEDLDEDEDGEDSGEDINAQLQAILGTADISEDPPDRPKKPRFYCAGAKRIDELTDKKWCDYKAHHRWYGPCPKCRHRFACLPYKRAKNEASRVTLGQATMDKSKPLVYHPTRIDGLDKVLGGGVVYAKTLLLGADRGAGKTTMLLQACDGFAQGGLKAYFASGEMERDSIIQYAKRIGIQNENIGLFGDPSGVDVEDLFDDVLAFGAKLLIIDSVQVATVSDVKGDIGSPAMIKAVTNMVTSFAQAKKRAVIMIGHLVGTGDYGGGQTLQFLVDGLVRMDIRWAGADSKGKPIDSMVRELAIEGKSRQGSSKTTSLVELYEEERDGVLPGIRKPSIKALRMLTDLHIEG